MKPLMSAVLMDSLGARCKIHNEVGFFIKMFEDSFRLLVAALHLVLSKALFTSLTQLNLAAPFGLEHLGSCNTAGRIGIEDRIDDVTATRLGKLASAFKIEGRNIPDAMIQ